MTLIQCVIRTQSGWMVAPAGGADVIAGSWVASIDIGRHSCPVASTAGRLIGSNSYQIAREQSFTLTCLASYEPQTSLDAQLMPSTQVPIAIAGLYRLPSQ
jgi:hypothetical protein